MSSEKVTIMFSIIIASLCYVSLCSVNAILFKKTRLKGFGIIAIGFACLILQTLVFLLAPASFLVSYGMYVSHIHTLALVVISIGFLVLLKEIKFLIGRG